MFNSVLNRRPKKISDGTLNFNYDECRIRAQVHFFFFGLFEETLGLDVFGQEEVHKHDKEERLTTKKY